MTATDITAEVTALAAAEVNAQCLGEDYGVAVAWAPSMIRTPQGPVNIAAWHLLMTARNPLLGESPLFHMVPLAATRPTAEQVKAAVADGLRQLRDLAASKLAGVNGRPKVPG